MVLEDQNTNSPESPEQHSYTDSPDCLTALQIVFVHTQRTHTHTHSLVTGRADLLPRVSQPVTLLISDVSFTVYNPCIVVVSIHLLGCRLHCKDEVDLPEWCLIALTGDIEIDCAKCTEPLAHSDACRQDCYGLTSDCFLCELHVSSSKAWALIVSLLKVSSFCDSLPNSWSRKLGGCKLLRSKGNQADCCSLLCLHIRWDLPSALIYMWVTKERTNQQEVS